MNKLWQEYGSLWKDYTKWVEKQNAPGLAEYTKDVRKHAEMDKKRWDDYKKEREAYNKEREDFDRSVEEWDNLPWYKKLTTPRPERDLLWYIRSPRMPMLIFPPMYFPKERVSYRGFMDWLSRKRSI